MAVTTMVVKGTYVTPNNTPATGTVTFTANTTRFVNTAIVCEAITFAFTLDGGGQLNGTTGVTIVRCTTGYTVVEAIAGAPPHTTTLTDGAGPVDMSSLA